MDIFVSVGSGLNPAQEAFVKAVEERLRADGLVPHTLDRNEWSTLAPLDAVNELMGRCQGAVILALERYHFSDGVERRGSARQQSLREVKFATAWNQIEAALAYSKQLPLLVIVDEDLKSDGLLEPGHGWYVTPLPLDVAALQTAHFNGLMKDWRGRLAANARAQPTTATQPILEPSKASIATLAGALRPAELYALLAAFAAILLGAFTIGVKFGPVLDPPPPAKTSTK